MSAVKTSIEPITITDEAVAQLNRIRSSQEVPTEHGLRVGVKGGGCSGFSYVLGFDQLKENDETYDIKGLRVIIQKAHAIYLLGMEIDWLNGLNNRGFTFSNPNATETCGCGTSFSA
ncbi:MAG: iron-sulfur cluster assembly accessory protein [Bacteroidota bacterium]